MISFHPYIDSRRKRPDGSYTVHIRITFKRKHKYLPTNLFASPYDLTTKTHKLKQGPLLSRCNDLIRDLQQIVSELSPLALTEMDIQDIYKYITTAYAKKEFSLDFFSWCDKQITQKTEGARHNYQIAVNAFERFLGKRALDINSITTQMLMDFSVFLDNEKKYHGNVQKKTPEKSLATSVEKKKGGASSRYLKSLASLYREAQDRFNDEDSGDYPIPKDPFKRVSVKTASHDGQKSLDMDLLQKIILEQPTDPRERLALDVFVVSFGLMGVNLADLYYADKTEEGVWRYNRIKTKNRRTDNAEMRVVIPPCIEPYVDRLTDETGRRWLKLWTLHPDKDRVNSKINRWLRIWQRRNNAPDFTLYATRHSWATIARNKAKVDKATVDECLAHSGELKMADIYVEKDWALINEANKKVLALFQWPE